MKISLYIVGILLMLQAMLACNSTKAKPDEPLTISGLQKNIADLVRDKSCDNVKQCRSIAYGAKACGGPTSYLVYSAKHTDIAALAKKAKQHNQLVREDNKKRGLISNCSLLIPPMLACKASQCVVAQ